MARERSPAERRSRPRILLDALAYAPTDGGFTTALHHVLASCREMDEFEFVVAHHRRYASQLGEFGLSAFTVDFPEKLRFFASLFLLPWLVRRVRADAVHCEISALPAGLGVPGSVTVHDLYFLLDPASAGRTVAKRITTRLYWERVFLDSLRRARIVKAISETSAGDARRLVGPDLPLAVVSSQVEPPRDGPEARSWPHDSEPVRLLFVGNIVPRKNLPLLLQALPHFRHDWRLDLVGNLGWGMAELETMAEDPRVTMHGYVSDAERDRLLAQAHVLIMPSLSEGFCYPVADAMSRGVLVLTSDIDVFREYVPDECRFGLSDPGLLAALYNRLDAGTYSRLLLLCRQAATRFSPDAHVESHREMFRRLTEPVRCPNRGSNPRYQGLW